MAWTLVQCSAAPGTNATAASDAPSLPAASTAGNLLVAGVTSVDSADTITGPSGWTSAVQGTQSGAGIASLWYYLANPGGITTATWTDSNTQLADAWMAEFTAPGVSGASRGPAGTGSAASAASCAVSASGAAAGDLAVGLWTEEAFSMVTWTGPAGWTFIGSDSLTSDGTAYMGCLLSMASGSVSATASSSGSVSAWAAAVVTFHVAAAAAGLPRRVLLNQAVTTAATW